jgi:hypothetical protein
MHTVHTLTTAYTYTLCTLARHCTVQGGAAGERHFPLGRVTLITMSGAVLGTLLSILEKFCLRWPCKVCEVQHLAVYHF